MAEGEGTPKASSDGKNVGMAILCYLGILVLIPLLTDAKNDPFVKFHIKQGLVLLITGVILGVISPVPVIGWLVGALGSLFILILVIMGIVNAAAGKEEKLPVIGQYADKFNI